MANGHYDRTPEQTKEMRKNIIHNVSVLEKRNFKKKTKNGPQMQAEIKKIIEREVEKI